VAGSPEEAAFLDERRARLEAPRLRGKMALLPELHSGDQFLAHARAIFALVEARCSGATVAAVGHANDLLHTLREWIATETWPASRALLEANRDLLLSEEVTPSCSPPADVDPQPLSTSASSGCAGNDRSPRSATR